MTVGRRPNWGEYLEWNLGLAFGSGFGSGSAVEEVFRIKSKRDPTYTKSEEMISSQQLRGIDSL